MGGWDGMGWDGGGGADGMLFAERAYVTQLNVPSEIQKMGRV